MRALVSCCEKIQNEFVVNFTIIPRVGMLWFLWPYWRCTGEAVHDIFRICSWMKMHIQHVIGRYRQLSVILGPVKWFVDYAWLQQRIRMVHSYRLVNRACFALDNSMLGVWEVTNVCQATILIFKSSAERQKALADYFNRVFPNAGHHFS
jgi:hypothetical protein